MAKRDWDSYRKPHSGGKTFKKRQKEPGPSIGAFDSLSDQQHAVAQIEYQGQISQIRQSAASAQTLHLQGAMMKGTMSNSPKSIKASKTASVKAVLPGKTAGTTASNVANRKVIESNTNASSATEQGKTATVAKNLNIQSVFKVKKERIRQIENVVNGYIRQGNGIPRSLIDLALEAIFSFLAECASLPEEHPDRDPRCPDYLHLIKTTKIDEDNIGDILNF